MRQAREHEIEARRGDGEFVKRVRDTSSGSGGVGLEGVLEGFDEVGQFFDSGMNEKRQSPHFGQQCHSRT